VRKAAFLVVAVGVALAVQTSDRIGVGFAGGNLFVKKFGIGSFSQARPVAVFVKVIESVF
jgi:hypothetical protein